METYQLRIRKYQRREALTTWIGAAYLALTALMTTKVFDEARVPTILPALLVTLIVVGGGFLGLARVGFEWKATELQRNIDDGRYAMNDQLSAADETWPQTVEHFYTISLCFIVAAGAVMVACAWWPVIKSCIA